MFYAVKTRLITLITLGTGIILTVFIYYRRCKQRREKLYKEFGFVDLPDIPNMSRFSQLCSFKNTIVSRMIKQTLLELQTFEIREGDVFVASFPKSGTTWTQEIVWLIMNDLDFDTAKKIPLTSRSPFIEMDILTGGLSNVAKMKSPRCLKTHLTYETLPPKYFDKNSKIIYVARNPKDVVVSYYYHHKSGIMKEFAGEFPEFWNLFIKDKVYCSPFWGHILSYWKRRHQNNVLFIKYEDMKKDLKAVIYKVAIFLGKPLRTQDIAAIADHCTFKKMKNNPSLEMRVFKVFRGPELLRKGIIGDWRNHLTVGMDEFMNKWCEKHLAGTGLTFDFD